MKFAMYDVRAIANWFLDRAKKDGEQLTSMKLQKLAYVSHGWHLAFYEEPLIHEAVEAWKWGPVFRSLYREFKEYGSMPIDKRATAFDGASLEERVIDIADYGEGSAQTAALLESIWKVYSHIPQENCQTSRTKTAHLGRRCMSGWEILSSPLQLFLML